MTSRCLENSILIFVPEKTPNKEIESSRATGRCDVTSEFIFKHLCSPLSLALISFNYSKWENSLYGPLQQRRQKIFRSVCRSVLGHRIGRLSIANETSHASDFDGRNELMLNNKSSRHLNWGNRLIKVELMLLRGTADSAVFFVSPSWGRVRGSRQSFFSSCCWSNSKCTTTQRMGMVMKI